MTASSEGARLLAAAGASLRAIGRAAGTSQESARRWLAGAKLPSSAAREALAEAFGVPPDAWDRAPTTGGAPAARRNAPRPPAKAQAKPPAAARSAPAAAPPAQPPPREPSPARPDDARARLQAQLERIDGLRAAPDLSPAAKLQLEAAEGRALALLAKLSGEGLTVSESKLVATPAFQRVSAALVAALAPWPDAQLAVAGALDELDGRAA